MSWGIGKNDGLVWPRSEGKWIWWASAGKCVWESVAGTRKEAEQEAHNAERELEAV